MRVRILLLVVVLCQLIPSTVSGQWKVISQGRDIVSFDLVDDMTAWIAGQNGFLMQTTDGGETWIDLTPGNEQLDFKCIDFVNDSLGWALVDYKIYRTTDGGRSWVQQQVKSLTWEKLCMLDENCGYAISLNSVYKTIDGKTWKQLTVPGDLILYMDEICFFDPETGVITAHHEQRSYVFSTTNGGESWVSHSPGHRPSGLQFSHDLQLYFLLEGRLCRTNDLFENWEQTSPSDDDTTILAFYHYADDEVVAFRNNRVVLSTDGGRTWNTKGYSGIPITSPHDGVCMKCFQETCFALNPELIFLKSQNRGSDWQVESILHPLFDVSFWDQHFGFILGALPAPGHIVSWGGNIYQTRDGGKTWVVDTTLNVGTPTLGLALNGSSALAIVNYPPRLSSSLFHTDNRGLSWNLIPYDESEMSFSSLRDIFFTNPNTGYLAKENQIFRTLNGGESWEIFYECTNEIYPNSIVIMDHSGWIVGEEGLVIKYTPSGGWHYIDVDTDLPLNKVFFINEQEGWISGGYTSDDGSQTFFASTEDGGETWNVRPDFGYIIHDLYFSDPLLGWAAGSDCQGKGVILKTENGGDTWAPLLDSLPGSLTALCMTDTFGIAVGDKGLIVGNTDPTLTGLNDKPAALPGDPMLRIMPNPFSSQVQLHYEIAEPTTVEITIYTINGIKTETLVHEWHMPGSYEISWNPSGHAPGVYFCELRTGQYREIRKMLLLK